MPLRICLLLALTLSIAAPVAAQDGGLLPRIIPPDGSFAVGRSAFQWTDTSRDEVHTPDASDARTLLVEVWYPADPAPDAQPGAYLDEYFSAMLDSALERPAGTIGSILSSAYPDAPLAEDQATYPVIVLDTGFGAMARQYTIIIEQLASHGYIVFGMSHPYVTLSTVMPDNTHIQGLTFDQLTALWEPADVYDAEYSEVWIPDTLFALEQIAALNETDERFAGRLDLDGYGMIGHSQGSRVVSEICWMDERCAGAVALDGGRSVGVDIDMDRPYMLILADNGVDNLVNEFERGMDSLGAGYYVFMIPRTTHTSFQDDAYWLPLAYPELTELPSGTVAAQRVLMDYRTYILTFFDRHVRGFDAPLLDGPDEDYPEVFILIRDTMPKITIADGEPHTITLGEEHQGTLDVGEIQPWVYTGQAGETLDIWLAADNPANDADHETRIEQGLMDTALVIRHPDGSLLTFNDDGTPVSTDSVLMGVVLPNDGAYTIEVRTWQNLYSGGYTLLVQHTAE